MEKQKINLVITGIIRDALIVDRMHQHLYNICNVMNPIGMDRRFEPMDEFKGIKNAFILLGIEDNQNLTEELHDIFDGYCFDEKHKVAELPEKIYSEWLSAIVAHNLKKAS
ncbi:hypothetical protein [Flagellimonas marina]|uniref:Uncharacterized protein n=1 Tax=Flagellimonas marina TaxID=1775168 RepID=A0ABV8PKP1_9FLAO